MILIIILVALYGLKFAEVSFMAEVSWWWINGLAFVAFIWFEFLERMLGFNKSKADMHHEKMRKERVKRNFKMNQKK